MLSGLAVVADIVASIKPIKGSNMASKADLAQQKTALAKQQEILAAQLAEVERQQQVIVDAERDAWNALCLANIDFIIQTVEHHNCKDSRHQHKRCVKCWLEEIKKENLEWAAGWPSELVVEITTRYVERESHDARNVY